MVKENLTSIIILSYNTLELTKMCLESIREHTPEDYELILVDNASTDGSLEYLREQQDVRLIENKENMGFPKGCNQGLAIAEGDSLLLLNSDTVVTENWLANLKTALYSHEKVGAVSCLANYVSNGQQIPVPYGRDMEAMQEFARGLNHSDPAKWEKRPHLVGFCYLFRRELYEAIGGLDERFTPGNFEDNDYSLRIMQQGYDLLLCKDTFIHHWGSASFRQMDKKLEAEGAGVRKSVVDYNLKNFRKFFEKWHVPTEYMSMPPEKVLEYLQRQAGAEAGLQAARDKIYVYGAPESLMGAFQRELGVHALPDWFEGGRELVRLKKYLAKEKPKVLIIVQLRENPSLSAKALKGVAHIAKEEGAVCFFVYNHPQAVEPAMKLCASAHVLLAPALYGLWDCEEEDGALPLLRALQQEALNYRAASPYEEAEGEKIYPLLHIEDLARGMKHLLAEPYRGMPFLVLGEEYKLKDVLPVAAWAAKCQMAEEKGEKMPLPSRCLRKDKEVEAGWLALRGGASVSVGMGLYHTLRRFDRSPMRVSACWIVKDGEEDIGYSMESVGEAADELIVVDTGSTDSTVEIAKAHTDRVYLYPWRNDFAAAKNFALTKASGDWIIFLDADEYFAKESTEHLRPLLEEAFQSPVPASYLMDLYNVRRGYEDQPGSKLPVTRIFRMLPGSGYQEAVHENLRRYPWVPLAVDAPKEIFLYHTGYIPERMKAKEARNIALLKETDEKGRASRLAHYYLTGLYYVSKEYEKAIQEAKLSIEAGEKPLYHAFAVYHNWYLSLEALGRDTTEALEAGLKAFPDMADFHAVKGMILKEEGKLEEAKAELEKALYLCQHHDELLPHEENRLAESGEIEKVKEVLKELA